MTYSDYSFANAIVLFGALQGILLLVFLFKKRQANPLAYWFFALFLFSLAYVNLWYALHFMEIDSIGTLPMIVISFPYEFSMGVGFYFYVKSQKKVVPPSYKKELYLFIPIVIYSLLQLYWSFLTIKEGDTRIYREIEATGFFAIIEYIRFTFNLILCILAIQYLNNIKRQNKLSVKEHKTIQWLFLLSNVFITYNVLSLLLTSIAFLIAPSNIIVLQSFYLTFFTNTIFIYWIGYVGFSKPNILFSSIAASTDTQNHVKHKLMEEKLIQIMEVEEEFKHPDFSLSKLALLSEISGKELSDYINTIHKCNVSEYINRYRVEKVKTLLDSSDFEHYTLEAIAREAGFKSKSSFNSIFKKHTTLTPSQYKKRERK